MQVRDPRLAVNRLVSAYRQSQCLRVAVRLQIPERLADGSKTAADLADECGAHEPSLTRLLRALVALEILVEEQPGRYGLTVLGQQLRPDQLGPIAELFNSPLYWEAWVNLEHSVRTGERAFDLVFGMREWDYFAAHPDVGARFDAAMAANTGPISKAVVTAHDFSRSAVVADIGGGDGTLLAEVLRRHPHIRAVLYDRPAVVERARVRMADQGLANRVEFVGGSFMESVPRGADTYVLKSIIHDWVDSDAATILARTRDAVESGTQLVIVERVVPDQAGSDGLEVFLMDLNMLVNNGGRERTADEFRALLAAAGFRLDRVVATATGQSVLESVAV